MPISSGALEWPVSFYRKPDADDRSWSGDSSPGTTPRGIAPLEYQWQPQLSNRQDYEKWRKQTDKKDPLRVKKPKRGKLCDCFPSKMDVFKDSNRKNPVDVIKRNRRRKCFLMGCCTSVFLIALTAAFIFTFLRYTGEEEIGPAVKCDGRLGKHYLLLKAAANGTNPYDCCKISDLTLNTTILGQPPVWPDGYVINESECKQRVASGAGKDKEGPFNSLGWRSRLAVLVFCLLVRNVLML